MKMNLKLFSHCRIRSMAANVSVLYDAASFLNISTPTLSRYLNGVLKNKTQMKYLK